MWLFGRRTDEDYADYMDSRRFGVVVLVRYNALWRLWQEHVRGPWLRRRNRLAYEREFVCSLYGCPIHAPHPDSTVVEWDEERPIFRAEDEALHVAD